MSKGEEKPKIIVICGPTATGKSALAVKLALKYDGEIISADSRQIYKGLDIATGKITKKEMCGIPHHMIDLISPKKNFSVSDYVKVARPILFGIIERGKIPIICGGTGFYISTLLGEMTFSEVKPSKNLRTKLSQKSASQLFAILKKLDQKRAETIDNKNPVRLIRAIEIAKSKNPKTSENFPLKNFYSIEKIGLDFPDEKLREKIRKRVISRFKQGMVNEADKLHKRGLSFRRMNELGLEYRALAEYLQNKTNREELFATIEREDWLYAKRQRTWFRRDREIRWINNICGS